jgi:uncharacterized membrane protein YfcA
MESQTEFDSPVAPDTTSKCRRRRVLLVSVLLMVLMLSLAAMLVKSNDRHSSSFRLRNNNRRLENEEDEGGDNKDRGNSHDESDGHGLDFDDQIYIDDDYVDDYYAYEKVKDGRPTLIPMEPRDIFGFLLASMAVTLAAGGGIGGGGLVVPIYILIMGLSPGDAIPISSVTVFGGALGSLLINCRKRHPLADRPLIDWNLMLVMEPLVLTGALVGTLLHRVLSEKLLVVLLVAMLSGMAHTTLSKARRMHQAETVYIERLRAYHEEQRHAHASAQKSGNLVLLDPPNLVLTPSQEGSEPSLLSSAYPGDKPWKSPSTLGTTTRQEIMILNPDFVSLRSELLQEEKVTPREKIIALCSMFSVLIFLNIMVGGGAFQSPWGIICGSVAFWVVQVIMGAFLVASAWAAQTYLVNRHQMKELVRFDYVHGDIRWDSRGAVIYPLFFCATGLFAGMFGIGGGMISVPLLLAMGVHPIVATATSSCMILFTSFSSVTSFAIFDLILWDYAAVCIFVGFFPTLLGQLLMQRARNAGQYNGHNFERNSIIAYAIGGVVLLSALLMTIQYVLSIVKFDSTRDVGGICEGYGRGTV